MVFIGFVAMKSVQGDYFVLVMGIYLGSIQIVIFHKTLGPTVIVIVAAVNGWGLASGDVTKRQSKEAIPSLFSG